LVFVAFLVPLGIYLVVLGQSGRRHQPMLVSGVFDRIGMLLGASGFLIAGGPAILTALNDRWRMWWLLGDPGAPRASLDSYLPWWLLACGGYFAVVVLGAAWLLWRARAWTCLYAIEGDAAAQALESALDELGLPWQRSGQVYLVNDQARLVLEPFDFLTTATLWFSPVSWPHRPALEAALARQIELAEAPRQDTGLWLSCAGLLAMASALLIIITLILRSSHVG
jgi:hypothetical protein